MGTRSLTIVKEHNDNNSNVLKKKSICTMYRQMDGYPTGHGLELAEFLKDMVVVNGISMAEKRRIANGMECLAAQMVAFFKEGPGSIYLYSGYYDCGQNYEYYVYLKDEVIKIMVRENYGNNCPVIFDGTPQEFIDKYGEKS